MRGVAVGGACQVAGCSRKANRTLHDLIRLCRTCHARWWTRAKGGFVSKAPETAKQALRDADPRVAVKPRKAVARCRVPGCKRRY